MAVSPFSHSLIPPTQRNLLQSSTLQPFKPFFSSPSPVFSRQSSVFKNTMKCTQNSFTHSLIHSFTHSPSTAPQSPQLLQSSTLQPFNPFFSSPSPVYSPCH